MSFCHSPQCPFHNAASMSAPNPAKSQFGSYREVMNNASFIVAPVGGEP